MELDIIISEPWNFESSNGRNRLKVKVINDKDGIITAEAISDYNGKGGSLIISERNKDGHVNIFQKTEDGNIALVMIGVYADKHKWEP